MAKYHIQLSVHDRTGEFGADNVTELFLLLANKLYQLDETQERKNNNSDEAAKKLIERYCQRFIKGDNRCHSPINKAGFDIDVAKCYLQKMTITETVSWLSEKKGFRTSKTAIGRYWVRFAQVISTEKAI